MSAGFLQAQEITYDNVYVDYDSAVEFQNLRIIPIRPKHGFGNDAPKAISLSQAIKQGIAVISERGTASTENVHFLRINNHSDQTIYISSGELISGGRQDRMVTQGYSAGTEWKGSVCFCHVCGRTAME